jgi:hypothetical protein
MSIPTNQLVFAGVWSATTSYPQYQFVQSPIDSLCYVNVAIQPSIGGPDPSVQPSAVWVLLNVPSGSGITSLNGLTDPALTLLSSDASITITPTAPSTINLTTVGGSAFPPAYGSFSSRITQNLAVGITTQIFYTDDDIPAVGMFSAITSPYLTVNNAGTYKVLSSLQLDKTGGGNAPVDMWIELNDVPVPNSATRLTINQNQEDIMTVEWFVQCVANQRISIVAYDVNGSGDLQALAVPPTVSVPAIPCIITTILRIA